jgi:hypothetical protein
MSEEASVPGSADLARLRTAIEAGGELLGAAGGGAIGLIGGPAGAIGGAAAGVALTRTLGRIGLEVYDRLIVRRQQLRVGATLGLALQDVDALSEAGALLRTDNFFDKTQRGRSDAEELTEGILLHAADAYQELKLRHLAAILPALAVRPDVSAADGHWITDVASRLTWRQLVVLAIFADPPADELMHHDIDQDMRDRTPLPGMFADEIEELAALGLVGTTNPDGEPVRVERTVGGIEGGVWGAPMATWRVTASGQLLAELTRLDDVPGDERSSVLQALLAAPSR